MITKRAKTCDGLAGSGLRQSRAEWAARNRTLAENMSELITRFAPLGAETAIDVGCQGGDITDAVAERTSLDWVGVDPSLELPTSSPRGHRLLPGSADSLAFPEQSFGVVLLANVYEHVLPDRRRASLEELSRVLVPSGVVVGQLPNPYFPIESHSRLPFMGWLPTRLQHAYWRLAPVPWEHDFFVVTVSELLALATAVGFEPVLVRNFNYPLDVIPSSVRWLARMLRAPMRRMPWAWQFVLRKPAEER